MMEFYQELFLETQPENFVDEYQELYSESEYKIEDFIDFDFDINKFYRYCRHPNCGRNPKYRGWCPSHWRLNK